MTLSNYIRPNYYRTCLFTYLAISLKSLNAVGGSTCRHSSNIFLVASKLSAQSSNRFFISAGLPNLVWASSSTLESYISRAVLLLSFSSRLSDCKWLRWDAWILLAGWKRTLCKYRQTKCTYIVHLHSQRRVVCVVIRNGKRVAWQLQQSIV